MYAMVKKPTITETIGLNRLCWFGHVHSVEQKSIGMIFHTSHSGSEVRYSCHHNLSRFTFPIFAQLWRFSVFYSLQSIKPRIY
jgi:hypothetical protein